ncbi:MAG: lipopolysaccharide heptosyltransferase II [Bacteroidetes bacterium]|nr:lipopolysaccharide heptosyltransferase II [Bacteroidota bacterium]
MRDKELQFLIIQTAFIGDAVLTLPLAQVIKQTIPLASVDVIAIPRTAEIFNGHSAIRAVYAFDKKREHSGIVGFIKFCSDLRRKHYDIALVPHRSLRSALIALWLKIPMRVGFDRSSGKVLLTHVVRYDPTIHEVERNLSLLQPLGIEVTKKVLPTLAVSNEQKEAIDLFLRLNHIETTSQFIAIAPGSIWNTKRWLPERFAQLAQILARKYTVFLIGGKEDAELCEYIRQQSPGSINCAGEFTLIQAAELIRRCRVLISNDSAPMHIAVAVGTPVVAIFGATVPEFGFRPLGPYDVVVEVKNLPCRPCGIHGGKKCPIKTFDCMKNISVSDVMKCVETIIQK